MAPADDPESGITQEIELLTPVRSHAGVLVDTSKMSPHDLRAELQKWFEPDPSKRLSILVQSFSYKRGVPRGVDTVFDCRFLRNPHWEPGLRSQTGRDAAVQSYVEADPLTPKFIDSINSMMELLLPAPR